MWHLNRYVIHDGAVNVRTYLNNLPINSIWPAICLLALTIGAIYWCWRRRRNAKKWYFWPLPAAIAGILLFALAGANWYFVYYPRLGDLYDSYQFPTGSSDLLTAKGGRFPSGVVVSVTIPSPASGVGAHSAEIFLPPQYFTAPPDFKFPVVYLYSGVPGTTHDWFVGGMAWGTGLAAAKNGRPAILVSPSVAPHYNADTECVNGQPGNWETYLAVDVPNWVASSSRSLVGASANATAGLSMGGYCAQMLALRHPDKFSMSGNFSGTTLPTYPGGLAALFGSGPDLVAKINSYNTNWIIQNVPASRTVNTWLEIGPHDDPALIADEKQFNAAAVALGMKSSFRFTERPSAHGGHNFYVWAECLADWLPQALDRLDQAAPPPPPPLADDPPAP